MQACESVTTDHPEPVVGLCSPEYDALVPLLTATLLQFLDLLHHFLG